jgi:hypothetical protein
LQQSVAMPFDGRYKAHIAEVLKSEQTFEHSHTCPEVWAGASLTL